MKLSSEVVALSDLFRRVASEELLPRHGRLRDDQVYKHSDSTLFTEADLRSEARLTAGARIIWPGVIATGEEDIVENPTEFLFFAQNHDVIIFDPIDGTGAFKRGEDTYGVMGAYISKGITVAGIIYAPGHAVSGLDGTLRAEKDLLIAAEKDNGCYLNGRRVTLAGRPTCVQDARIAFACRNQDRDFEPVLAAGLPGYRTRHNASHDYERLITGISDATFYSEGFTAQGLGKCPPWDHAAGVLAVEEAGGIAALPYAMAGRNYAPLQCHDRLLVCANETLFQSVFAHLRARAPQLCAPRV